MAMRGAMLGLFVAALAACDPRPTRDRVAAVDTTTSASRPPVEHWGRMLTSSRASQADRQAAIRMLGLYEREAVPYITAIGRFLESSNDSLAFGAAWALAQVGPEAQPLLVRSLSHPSARVRRRAAYSLGEIGPEVISGVDELKKLADGDPANEVRWMAKWAVDRIGKLGLIPDPDLFLTAGLTDDDITTRFEAIRRLGASHPSDRIAVIELIRLLGDSTEVIRYAAIDALVQKGAPAVPALTMALNSPRQIVRAGAMMAMARMHRSL